MIKRFRSQSLLAAVVAAGVFAFAGGVAAVQPEKAKAPEPAKAAADFNVEGVFVEACSCRPPCPCELTGVNMPCNGVGAYQIERGKYAGEDLSGAKIAYAVGLGEWVNLYIDAKDDKQRVAAEKFARAVYAAFGPIKEVKAGKIDFAGKDGAYTVTVDGGKIMKCQTEPVLGGDNKTPIGHTNIKNPVNSTVYQGTCVVCTYSDGDKKFTVEKGRNAYFNPKVRGSGKI